MNWLKSSLLCGLLITLLSVSLVQAQSKGAAEAFAAGYEVYSSGDYKNAAGIYEKLLKDYPTDPIIPAAQLQLASLFTTSGNLTMRSTF
jgi:TolA-binding protein